MLGIGLAHVSLRREAHETAVELFYKWQVAAGISVQPDFQWVLRPGGRSPSAFLGLRLRYEY